MLLSGIGSFPKFKQVLLREEGSFWLSSKHLGGATLNVPTQRNLCFNPVHSSKHCTLQFFLKNIPKKLTGQGLIFQYIYKVPSICSVPC